MSDAESGEAVNRSYVVLAVLHFLVFGGGIAAKALRAGEPLWVAGVSGFAVGGIFFAALWSLGKQNRDLVGGADG